MIYRFAGFELDTELFELRRGGTPVAVEPQVFNVLAYLVANRDRVVSKNELLDNVWGDRFVSESALTTRIKAARRAVGDDGKHQHVIRTLHGRGYRFVAAVEDEGEDGSGDGLVLTPEERTPDHPAATWPMVGRGPELEQLAAWFRSGEPGGVLLAGGAGLGKTRLAEECLRLAVGAGLPIARAAGHPESRSIPFAALAHLLPADLSDAVGPAGELDRAAVFHRARAALQAQAGAQRLLVLVDDADLLDDLSRALLASLVQSRTVFAVLTMRTGGGATPFDHLLKDGHLERIDVGPLRDEAVDTLLHRVLGGPLVAPSARQLRESALGNPGVLRQLVEAAIDDGSLVEHDGVWHLTAALQPTPSLERLVGERLRGLDDAHRHAGELFAVAGDLPLDVATTLAGDVVLEDLERRGLINIRRAGRRSDLGLAHPLFGEVLLRDLPVLRGRRLRRELADAIEAVGARRRDDRFRLVAWRVEGGGQVEPALLLDATRFALLDGNLAVAEQLVRRAEEEGAGARATQLRAELHFRRNEPVEVENVLATIDLSDLDQADRVRVVRRRAGNRYYGLTDGDGALAVFDEANRLITDPEARRSVTAHRSIILAMAGQVGEALDCIAGVEAGGDAVRFEALRAHSLSLAAAGRGEDALALIEDARALHERLDPDLHRPGRTILLFNELFALTELGRFEEARALSQRAVDEGLRGGRRAWVAFAIPRFELTAGDGAAALRAGEPYAIEARARGDFGAERWILALVGMARLLSGDHDGGRRDVERVTALWPTQHGLFRSDRDRAQGWLAAELGDLPGARAILRAGADDAGARGALALEAMLLHDTVRFGGATEVVDRLVSLAGQVQGALMEARVLHATGIVAADADRLADVVERFETLGSPLLAAEAALDLAVARRTRGDRAGAGEAIERSRTLRGLIDGPVVTPLLAGDEAGYDKVTGSR